MSFESIKEVVVVIHPNTSLRTYAVTKILHSVNIHHIWINTKAVAAERLIDDSAWLLPLAQELMDKEYIDHIEIDRTDIRVHASNAFKDRWELFSDDIAAIVSKHVFDGQATVRGRDESHLGAGYGVDDSDSLGGWLPTRHDDGEDEPSESETD